MNSQEKKALLHFILIYTLSSIILVAIIAYLYYQKEIATQNRLCQHSLQNSIIKVESDLLKSKLYQKDFEFIPSHYELNIGLFDKQGQQRYGNLNYTHIDLSQKMHQKMQYIHLIKKLQTPLLEIQYLVAEDTGLPKDKKKLISLIMIVISLAFIFIAFIGYLLSRLLLKPVKEKIAHIDRFIKDSAHEINTPIASLLMSVSMLKKRGSTDVKILNHISTSSKQISDIYNSLSHLAFDTLQQPLETQEVDLKEIVEKSIAFYQEIALSKHITITTHLAPHSIMIATQDAKKLINNLLSNAVKYNKIGKTISVSLQHNLLQVSDEGIGIQESEKKEILKRYHRATTHIGGFGIGLDIVNAICQRYGIDLDIISKKGKGSTFSLDFKAIAI